MAAKKGRKEAAPYRILSLDGGGIRGVLTAVWLGRLEEELGRPLWKCFDLVAGTSTGSILACAVSQGMAAARIVDLYTEKGREVFPSSASRLWSRARRLFTEGVSAPKYDGEGLQAVLRSCFRETKFGSLRIRPTLVTSYNLLTRDAVVFKSTRERYRNLRVWEVVKSSCSAPTYFPAHVLGSDGVRSPLADGGVVANNPAACAIAEGVRINRELAARGRPCRGLEDFIVASFGTGELTRPISIEESREWGLLEWAQPISDVLLDGAADAVHYVARQLIREDRYFRFQTKLDEARDDMDDASRTNVNALRNLAERHLSSEGGQQQIEKLAGMLGPA